MASFTNSTVLASSFLRFRAVAVAPGTAPTQPPPVTFQQGWRCCGGCRGLVYADGPDPGPCVAGGRHATGASATYALQFGDGGPGMQAGWRWCQKCQGMTFSGAPGICPAGGPHDLSRSAAYALTGTAPAQGQQTNWRWCGKCSGLAFAEGGAGPCPAGGTHDHGASGAYALTISALPSAPVAVRKPQLFLVETYQLSNCRGGLLRDELIATLQPMQPHQDQTVRVLTRKRTEQETKQASTVLDMQSSQASDSFNNHVKQSADSKFAGEHYDYATQANFHGEGSIGFGSASMDASLDVAGATNNLRNELANSVSSAMDTQVSQANQARRESVRVASTDQKSETTTETEVVIHTTNPTDTVMNFGIFQLKQEHVSILSLVDVEIGFQNTVAAESRKVPLFRLDELLGEVIEKPSERAAIKAQIRDCLSKVRDNNDEAKSIIRDDGGQTGGFIVNKRLQSQYELRRSDGSVRQVISVPGIVIRAWTKQLKKPGATVVAAIQ